MNQPGAIVLGNWRFKKLDLPIFNEENPYGWITRAERYFKFYRLTEDEKVKAAVLRLRVTLCYGSSGKIAAESSFVGRI